MKEVLGRNIDLDKVGNDGNPFQIFHHANVGVVFLV